MKTQWQAIENCKNKGHIKMIEVKSQNRFFVVASEEAIRGFQLPIKIQDFDGGEYDYGHLEL